MVWLGMVWLGVLGLGYGTLDKIFQIRLTESTRILKRFAFRFDPFRML